MYSYLLGMLGFMVFLLCAGCTELVQYRTNPNDSTFYKPCKCTNITCDNCKDATIEDHKADNYSLAFVEFDDQGSLWNRKQLEVVLDQIVKEGEEPNGLLLVVFIHGWKNNAKYDNGNVIEFRKSLGQLALLEKNAERGSDYLARKVMGLYVGWRGLSLKGPGIKNLSFWERKNTAETVGHGAVTEFLIQVEQAAKEAKKNNSNTDLVIFGHSFGGLILYSALSQIMMERMVESQDHAFGDLVVMVNPAIEAARFTPLQQLAEEQMKKAAEQNKSEGHYPVLAILTSKGDEATKCWFKIGRRVSTLFEGYRDPFQREADRTAVGHFQPYTTHELITLKKANEKANGKKGTSVWGNKDFFWDKITSEKGYAVNFDKVQLIHENKSAPENPIMVISVDEDVMKDHNDIFNENLRSFLAELIVSKYKMKR